MRFAYGQISQKRHFVRKSGWNFGLIG